MPNKDGTGPLGKGPRTGRCFGSCSQDANATSTRGAGRGRGLGFRNVNADEKTASKAS